MKDSDFARYKPALTKRFVAENDGRLRRISDVVERILIEVAEDVGQDGEVRIHWDENERNPIVEFDGAEGLARKRTSLRSVLHSGFLQVVQGVPGVVAQPQGEDRTRRLCMYLYDALATFEREEALRATAA